VLPSIGRNKEEEEESHSSVPAINGMSQFNAIDTDKSGEVSRSQWIEHYGNADLFDAYDADGNSFINAAEFMAGESSKGKFQAIDNNGDGVISRAEWMAKFGAATLFDLYDTDGDGEVSLDDFIQGQAYPFGLAPFSFPAPSIPTVARARGVRWVEGNR